VATKDLVAGITELRILLSQPKLLASPHYTLVEVTEKELRLTHSMGSVDYKVEFLETPGSGPLKYIFEIDIKSMYTKSAELTVFLEKKDEVQTRMRIEARRVQFKYYKDMEAGLEYLTEDVIRPWKSVIMELQTFLTLVEGAINSNLPHIKDAVIVQGDYVGAKVDIKDSVMHRSDITVDGKPPPTVHVRADSYVSKKVDVKDSVVQRADIGVGEGDTNIDGSVVIGRSSKEKVGGAADCLGDPNLETYRKALEQAMADGVIVGSEENMLRVLRGQLGVTAGQHDALLADIRRTSNKNIETYRKLLDEALKDGVLDPDEEGMLESMRQGLGISMRQHELLLEELKR
jgi:hypothetical protein